jgi:hypothetical protein
MLWIIRRLADRLKALLLADAALDLEAEFAARHADRKALLLGKADEYAGQGLGELAEELRGRAEALSADGRIPATLTAAGELDQERAGAAPPEPARAANARRTLTAANGSGSETAKPKTARQKARRR